MNTKTLFGLLVFSVFAIIATTTISNSRASQAKINTYPLPTIETTDKENCQIQQVEENLVCLVSYTQEDFRLAISPDRQWITYVSTLDGNPEIYLMRTDEKEVLRLTNNDVVDNFPTWSEDGEWIRFASQQNGIVGIYQIRPDGSDLQVLAPNYDGTTSQPEWLPEDQWTAFSCWKNNMTTSEQINPNNDNSNMTDSRWVSYTTTTNNSTDIYRIPGTKSFCGFE